MIKQYQVTLYNPTGKYRPVSCIVNRVQTDNTDLSHNKQERKEIQKAGIVKICQKRLWTLYDLTKYEYTRYKIRPYEKE